MAKTLVISGHPDLASSYTNSVIVDELGNRLEDVEVRRLDQLYPDFKIDVDAEQAALLAADVIVLQFPFYWYSVPALLKKWIDDVFSYNFAYGAKGDKLKGKDLLLSFTIGGPQESYDPLGYNHFNIEQLIKPLQQMVYLTGMNFISPVYSHGMIYIPGVYNELDDVQARAKAHADRVIDQVNELLTSPEKRISQFVKDWFANFDQLPDESQTFTRFLAKDVNIVMPEGNFVGHAGFRDWYQIAKNTFKPDCQHIVEQISVKAGEGNRYNVELRIRLIADTLESSDFKGESVNMLVNEYWSLSLGEDGNIQIHDYRVVAAAE